MYRHRKFIACVSLDNIAKACNLLFVTLQCCCCMFTTTTQAIHKGFAVGSPVRLLLVTLCISPLLFCLLTATPLHSDARNDLRSRCEFYIPTELPVHPPPPPPPPPPSCVCFPLHRAFPCVYFVRSSMRSPCFPQAFMRKALRRQMLTHPHGIPNRFPPDLHSAFAVGSLTSLVVLPTVHHP